MKERTFDLSKIKEEIDRRGGDGKAVAEAYHDYYNFHEIRICEWLAKLFDPDIGGFYYSNSGRDNDILVRWDGVTCKGLPDIESTYQALSFMKQTGMIRIIPRYLFGCERKYATSSARSRTPRTDFSIIRNGARI